MRSPCTRVLRALAVLLLFASPASAKAFHQGGVAYCDGCHTMHASEGNYIWRRPPFWPAGDRISQYQAGPYLLQGTTQSGACLNCHEWSKQGSYYVSTSGVPTGRFGDGAAPSKIPQQLTPGGDFAWLKLSYTWVSPRAGGEWGSRHGHNVIAPEFGYAAQAVGEYAAGAQPVGPGGNYPFATLHCSSCHDPHGKTRLLANGQFVDGTTTSKPIYTSGSYGAQPTPDYAIGSYRLLGGVGYRPMSITDTSLAFVNPPPIAVAPSSYNRSEAQTQTRVAYGQGMSEWCANCHQNIHANVATPVSGSMRHPTGANAKLAGTNTDNTAFDFAANYNSYVKTGDLTGAAASSFNSLVQYEEGTGNLAALGSHANIDGSYLAGPTGTMNVSCLSCHRAHATAFQSMTRWENKSEFLTVDEGSGVAYADQYAHAAEGVEARGKNATMMAQAYYGRPATAFSGWQRSLCNKCHVKD